MSRYQAAAIACTLCSCCVSPAIAACRTLTLAPLSLPYKHTHTHTKQHPNDRCLRVHRCAAGVWYSRWLPLLPVCRQNLNKPAPAPHRLRQQHLALLQLRCCWVAKGSAECEARVPVGCCLRHVRGERGRLLAVWQELLRHDGSHVYELCVWRALE